MDLDEWELLSDDGFIDHLQSQDSNLKTPISRHNFSLHPSTTIDMDYFQKFNDPPPTNTDQREPLPNQTIPKFPVPFEEDKETVSTPIFSKKSEEDEFADMKLDSPEFGIEVGFPQIEEKDEGFDDGVEDKETVSSPIFSKKSKEDEFADMKLDSPESGIEVGFPQIDLGKAQFEGFDDGVADEKSPKEEDGEGFNFWKIGMSGIGALCSFGFACATVCVIALGCRHREMPRDQMLHFQIYADDKRMKQVVHHAAKLNEAISAARGAPISRAHITIGGYFEGL